MSTEFSPIARAEGFKPCPFCGNIALDVDSKELFETTQNDNKHHVAAINVTCGVCRAEMWQHSHECERYEEQLDKLREKWNRRVCACGTK